MPDYSRRRCRTCSRASAKARRAGVRCTPALEGSFDPVAWALLLVACDAGFVIRAAAHRGEALLEAGLLEDRLDLLDDLFRRVEVAEAELFADLEQVLHVGGPLLAPGLADGGEHEVRVAAHALVVEGAAPLGEHLHVRAAAAAVDLHGDAGLLGGVAQRGECGVAVGEAADVRDEAFSRGAQDDAGAAAGALGERVPERHGLDAGLLEAGVARRARRVDALRAREQAVDGAAAGMAATTGVRRLVEADAETRGHLVHEGVQLVILRQGTAGVEEQRRRALGGQAGCTLP